MQFCSLSLLTTRAEVCNHERKARNEASVVSSPFLAWIWQNFQLRELSNENAISLVYFSITTQFCSLLLLTTRAEVCNRDRKVRNDASVVSSPFLAWIWQNFQLRELPNENAISLVYFSITTQFCSLSLLTTRAEVCNHERKARNKVEIIRHRCQRGAKIIHFFGSFSFLQKKKTFSSSVIAASDVLESLENKIQCYKTFLLRRNTKLECFSIEKF
jgi:hypothetical protein